MKNLNSKAWLALVVLAVAMGLVLFVPAGHASASLYLLGTPLALGSYWAFVSIAAMIPFLIWRFFDEERFLAKNLSGYDEYQKRVRHRLVPYLW